MLKESIPISPSVSASYFIPNEKVLTDDKQFLKSANSNLHAKIKGVNVGNFDGIAAHIVVPFSSELNAGADGITNPKFAITGRIFMRDATRFRIATRGITSSTEVPYYLGLGGSDKISFQIGGNGQNFGSVKLGKEYDNALTGYENEWLFFIAEYTGGTTIASISISMYRESDGTKIDLGTTRNVSSGSFTAMSNANADLYIGRFSDYANGEIADISIITIPIDISLGEPEILELKNGNSAGTTTVFQMPIIEGFGNIVHDISGFDNHGQWNNPVNQWSKSDHVINYLLLNGVELYQDDATGLDNIYIPYRNNGSKISPVIAGFSKTGDAVSGEKSKLFDSKYNFDIDLSAINASLSSSFSSSDVATGLLKSDFSDGVHKKMLILSSEDEAINRVRVYTRNRAIGSNFTYTETVPIAGYEDDDWTNPGNLNGLTTGRTVLQRIRGARSNVGIKEIKLHIKAVGDSSTWQFVVFEDNGSSVYNQVFTEDISVIVGDQTIPIVGSHVLEPGQLVGLKVPVNGTVGLKNTVSNDPVIFENALVTTGTFSNSTTNSIMTLLVFGSEPTMAVTGDSIMAGSNGAEKFFTYFDSGSTIPDYVPGELDAAINQIIFQVNIKDSSITYQNLAQGGQTFNWVDTVAMDEVIRVKPKILIIHAGTNDIDNGVIWSSVEVSLNSINGKLPSGTQLFIDEILPRNDWNDTKAATSRTFNTNLQIWCNANDATLIVCHDALGKIRSSTGELDDLKDEFNLDDVHLTLDGVKLMAHLIHKSLLNFVKF